VRFRRTSQYSGGIFRAYRVKVYDTAAQILKRKGHDVWSVSADATVYQAIEIMAEKRIGALLVLDGGKLVGIVSERDYARKVILKGRSSRKTHVREIMTAPVIYVRPGDSVDECMKIITERRIRHLPVVEGEEVAGIVSIGDVVKWIMSAQEHTIQQLQNYVTGHYPP
jgi:CBS domain-containing protein